MKYQSMSRPLLAGVACIAFCYPTLLTAQNNVANAGINQAVAEQLQQMQQQLNQQQQQINQLQGQLEDARQQLKSVSSGTSSQPILVPASYPAASLPGEAVASAPEGPPPGPTVIPAIAPVRTLPVDPPRTGGLLGLKVGPVTFSPYGFVKATAVRDSSMPDGDDFPFGFIFLNSASLLSTGVGTDNSFHVKARSSRFGMNIEWPDISPKLTLTGRLEGDFEGNFNEADNSDVTSYRSPNVRLRVASVRMDYHASENTDIYFLGGQDWTLFGSGVVPNLLETTILASWYGTANNRLPQLRGGWVQTLSHNRNVKLLTEFGIADPLSGDIEKLSLTGFSLANGSAVAPLNGGEGLAVQLGQGEREGSDSGRPQVEGRVTLQFQLDQAKGVAPAQIMVSGFQGRRQYVPFAVCGNITAAGVFPFCSTGVTAFTAGETAAIKANPLSSQMYGGQIGVQLPTRWATVSASLYRGAGLRVYAANQINDFATFNCPTGDTTLYLATLDGNPIAAGPAFLCQSSSGAISTAREAPIRGFGGFVQAGFPLSRWFNADPKGHNAGWQLYFAVGKDQILHRDLTNPALSLSSAVAAPLPLLMSKYAAVTLFYKVNQWASFGFEQSIYASRLVPGATYTIAGVGSNEWQDHRTEFGPIFTF